MSDASPRFIEFEVPGEPVAFARSGQNRGTGVVAFTPKKQRDYMKVTERAARASMFPRPLLAGALALTVVASYMRPASWSKRRAATTAFKVSRPDADNIGKLIADSINEIVYVDDAKVVHLDVWKVYGDRAFTAVRVEEIAEGTFVDADPNTLLRFFSAAVLAMPRRPLAA